MKRIGSIKVRTLIMITAVSIPMIAALCISMLYATKLVKDKAYSAEVQSVQYYGQNVDYTLSNLKDYLTFCVSTSENLHSLIRQDPTDFRYRMDMYAFYRELIEMAKTSYSVNYMFLYDERAEKCYIAAYNSGEQYGTRQQMARTIEEYYCKNGLKTETSWNCIDAGSSNLLYAIHYGPTCIGISVSSEKLLNISPVEKDEGRNVLLLSGEKYMASLTDADTESLPLTGADGDSWITMDGMRYLLVSKSLNSGDFTVVGIIPKSVVYENIQESYMLVLALAFVMVIAFVVFFFMQQRQLLRPISDLADTMMLVGEGNTELRVEKDGALPDELAVICDSFNTMMDRIMQLQTELLLRQKQTEQMRLQQFQYQIRPHFFLNTLNTIYGLAETRQNDIIQTLVLSLSKYFRYIFSADKTFVRLSEECQCVSSFAVLRSIAYRAEISVNFDIRQGCGETLIPTFTIMTFVENSFKHGYVTGRPLHVNVAAARNGNSVSIRISDDGKGFDYADIDTLNREHGLKSGGNHIGIRNACERLRISYTDQTCAEFFNTAEGGACVRLQIPYMTEENETGYVQNSDC